MRKAYYIFFIFILGSVSLNAQDSYSEMKRSLIINYQTMDMFELINKSSDLLSMNPDLSDGYVFLLWNDIQSGAQAKAQKRIEKIKEGKISDDVQQVFDELMAKFEGQKKESDIKKQSEVYLTNGDTLRYYQEMYKNAIKNDISANGFLHVFNYVSYLIDRMEYRSALNAIQEITKYPDYETKKQYEIISSKLKTNKKIAAELNYEEYARKGRAYMAQEKYDDALEWLIKAKNIRNTNTIKNAIDSATELKLYQKCVTTRSLDVYEEYYKTYPYGLYAQTIKKGLDDYYYGVAKKSYDGRSFAEAEKHFNYYINRFNSGDHIYDARNLLCQTYYNIAESNYLYKSTSNYSEAKKYYELYIGCSNNAELKSKLRKRVNQITRKIDMWNDDDYMIFAYSFEPNAMVGYSNFTLSSGPSSNMGIYFNFRKSSLAWEDPYYELDEYGKVVGISPDKAKLSGDSANAKWMFSVGFTKPLFKNTWLLFAVGGEKNKFMKEVDVYDYNGDFDRTEYALDIARSKWGMIYETGLIFNFAPLNFKLGGSWSKVNKLQPAFSVGISVEL